MTKIFKWIIFCSIIGSVITVFIGAHFTLKYIRMNRDVSIEYTLSENVSRGEPFSVNIKVENKGTAPLKNAELTLKLGKEIINDRALSPSELNSVVMHLGDITSNSLGTGSTTLTAIEASEEHTAIIASLRYTNQSGTKYETEQNIPISIKENSPVQLQITAPSEIVNGSFTDIDVAYENKSKTNFRSARLKIDYPNSFQFISANLPPEENKNIWNLGEIQENGKGNIRIRGLIESQNKEPLTIKAIVNLRVANKDFPIGEASLNTETTRTPIEIELSSDQANIVEANGDLNITAVIKNTSGIPLSNTTAKLLLSGAYRADSLETTGKAVNGSTTIIWDSSNSDDLLNWSSGAAKELKLKIKAKDPSALLLLNERDRLIKITAEVTSETIPSYIKTSQTKAVKTTEIQVVNGFKLNTATYFHDPENPAINSGSMPLKVDVTTDLTIHWTLLNYGEPLENIIVKSRIPETASWKNAIKNTKGTGPRYDEATREVTWQINTLQGEEISGQTKAVFQISITPETKNIGSYLPILDKTIVTATNAVTREQVSAEKPRLTTELTNDPSVSKNDGKVIP